MKISVIDFSAPSHIVAHQLIGSTFTVNGVGGIIVETEAYDQCEPASHCYIGKTPRNAAMFGSSGCAYVYRSYGIHWCLNFVCGEEGYGAGVLIRAIQPTIGIKKMRERRKLDNIHELCSGPGKLGQALAIEYAMNGKSLSEFPFELSSGKNSVDVICGPRIGIAKAKDLPWRFGLKDSLFLSRPFK